jgi:hypothetical protein
MNDEIESLKPTQHLATQAACCHWAPIVPLSADAPEGAGESPVTPNLAEFSVAPAEKKPD